MRLQLSHVLTPDPSDRDSRAGSCAPTALRLCLLQVLSVTRGGFSHLACFMEVQQMALQHAGGAAGTSSCGDGQHTAADAAARSAGRKVGSLWT